MLHISKLWSVTSVQAFSPSTDTTESHFVFNSICSSIEFLNFWWNACAKKLCCAQIVQKYLGCRCWLYTLPHLRVWINIGQKQVFRGYLPANDTKLPVYSTMTTCNCFSRQYQQLWLAANYLHVPENSKGRQNLELLTFELCARCRSILCTSNFFLAQSCTLS